MMGRKLEEGDWSKVYCKAKNIPEVGWSNLHIDVSHEGLGLELKLLRVSNLGNKSLKSVCGTTLMHPAATRSIRIHRTNLPANNVMHAVFKQYKMLMQQRMKRVRESAPGMRPDMRTGWLIWEDNLAEFLYFEVPMVAPDPNRYFAEWNETPARGARKASRSLWVYDKKARQKRYSITTGAGIKIQPYFDVPPPSDRHLYYFRVQSEPIGKDTIRLWIAASTASALRSRLGSLDRAVISKTILETLVKGALPAELAGPHEDLAVSVDISLEAHARLRAVWDAVSDEHLAQLLLKALDLAPLH